MGKVKRIDHFMGWRGIRQMLPVVGLFLFGLFHSLLMSAQQGGTTLNDLAAGIERPPKDDTFVFYLFLLISGIFIFVKQRYPSHFEGLLRSLTNVNMARQFFEDPRWQAPIMHWLLNINMVLIFATVLFLILRKVLFVPGLSDLYPFVLFGILASSVAIFHIAKRLLTKAIATLLPFGTTISFYQFNIDLIYVILSILIAPFTWLLAYGYTGLAQLSAIVIVCMTLVFIAYRAYKGLFIARPIIMRYKFHFFVYLCTLEIAPLLIISKLLFDQFGAA